MSTSQTPLKGEERHHSIDLFFFHFVALGCSAVKQCLRFHVGEITTCQYTSIYYIKRTGLMDVRMLEDFFKDQLSLLKF